MFTIKIQHATDKIGFNVFVRKDNKITAFYCEKENDIKDSVELAKQRLLNDK
jgi:hypothetical protein